MNKKKYTVKWIALLMQAVCLFFVFSGAAHADDPACDQPAGKPAGFNTDTCNNCVTHCSTIIKKITKPSWSINACIDSCEKGGCVYDHYKKNPSDDNGLIKECLSVSMNQGQGIVRYMLIPLQFLITYVAYIMAFFFLAWGLYRLRHAHEGGGANRQASGIGSALCFFAAALLFQYQYAVKLVGTSFLGLPTANSTSTGAWDFGKKSDGTIKTLPMDPPNLFGYFNLADCKTNHNQTSCSQLAGEGGGSSVGILTSGAGKSNNWSDQSAYSTLQTLFATLMIIGFISFVRGAMLIVKAGEGAMQAGESTGTKAVTHILAGGLLCNANHVASVINNMTSQISGGN